MQWLGQWCITKYWLPICFTIVKQVWWLKPCIHYSDLLMEISMIDHTIQHNECHYCSSVEGIWFYRQWSSIKNSRPESWQHLGQMEWCHLVAIIVLRNASYFYIVVLLLIRMEPSWNVELKWIYLYVHNNQSISGLYKIFFAKSIREMRQIHRIAGNMFDSDVHSLAF